MKPRRFFTILWTVILAELFVYGAVMLADGDPWVTQNKPDTLSGKNSQLESGVKYDGPYNFLVLGLDYEGIRTDTILFANFDPMESKLNILSVERDTKVYADGRYCKINALYAMGKEQYVMQAVEKITGLPLNYYITLNFKGFRELVDALGGVEFEVPFDMDYDDPTQDLHIHLKQGWQLLDGDKAEQLVRYRKGNKHGEGYIDGDVGRIKTQQAFIKAMISQKLKLVYLSKLDELFAIVDKYMRTNISINDIKYYLSGIAGISSEKVKTYTMPGDSTYEDNIWYFFYDRKKTLRLINNNFSK